jgi:2-dehydro-3-deoxygluconokinase
MGHVLCFGEILLRLSAPGGAPLFHEPRLDANFGGAEANVAVALARLGVPSAMLSALPHGQVGDAARDGLRRHGVDTSRIVRGDGRLGLYYLTPGAGLRASAIAYDRIDSLFARTPAAAYDWPALLEGASWLHLSGIIPAIGPEAARVSLGAIAAARAAEVRVSFDGNFRASMWARWCPDPAPILCDHVEGADLLFGNHRDIALMLGRDFGGDGPERRREAAEAAFARFPQLAHITSTARHAIHARHNSLSARIDTPAEGFETEALDIADIVDRIGTGDAFAAGVLARLDDGIEAAARAGLHLAALKHWTPGDQSLATADDLEGFAQGGHDVRR